MKIRTAPGVAACAALVTIMFGPAAHAEVWQRSANWVSGTQGSTANNPSPVAGTPVWQYEAVQGGALGSGDPWYTHQGALMTWDAGWYQTGLGVWSKGDNLNPPIMAGRLIHNVHPSVYNDIPLVRWMNPLGNGWMVNIAGTMVLNWNGVNGLGRPVDVDVVIAKIPASGAASVLYSATVSKPQPFPSVGDSVNLPVSLSNVSVNAGDSIVFTLRGKNSVGPLGAWVNLYDSLIVTSIPSPASAALLGLGGVLAVLRRRR